MEIKNFGKFGLFGSNRFITTGYMEDLITEAKEYTCKGIMNRVTLSTINFDKEDNIIEGTTILIFDVLDGQLIIINNLV